MTLNENDPKKLQQWGNSFLIGKQHIMLVSYTIKTSSLTNSLDCRIRKESFSLFFPPMK